MVEMQNDGVPAIGTDAPDFTLPDTEQKSVSLHDFRGQTVVLVFFPAAFSGACTAEMCAFRDSLSQFNDANAQVLGISVDLPYALRKFKDENRIAFPLLSDFDHEVIETYNIVNHNFSGFTSGVAKRAVFVIDQKGKITWEWVSDNPGQQPDYPQILEAIQQL